MELQTFKELPKLLLNSS